MWVSRASSGPGPLSWRDGLTVSVAAPFSAGPAGRVWPLTRGETAGFSRQGPQFKLAVKATDAGGLRSRAPRLSRRQAGGERSTQHGCYWRAGLGEEKEMLYRQPLFTGNPRLAGGAPAAHLLPEIRARRIRGPEAP